MLASLLRSYLHLPNSSKPVTIHILQQERKKQLDFRLKGQTKYKTNPTHSLFKTLYNSRSI